jgi:hypothetical protein
MSDGFRVDPTYVAGYRTLCWDTVSDLGNVRSFVRTKANSDSYFTGLVMGNLRDIVDAYAAAVDDRLGDRQRTLSSTASELGETAWQYHTRDLENAISMTYDPARGGLVEADFPGGEFAYDRTQVGPLEAPAVDEDGGSDYVMEDAGTDLTVIVEVANFVTSVLGVDFDPVGLVTDPLTGNWNALDQKGQVLAIAGDAAETTADNLTNALPTLFGQWEGGAAESFDGYLNDLTAALRYEGPLNRVVGEVYAGVALIIREGARVAIQLIGMLVTRIRRYATSTGLLEMGGEIVWDTISGAWDWVFGGGDFDPLEALREEWEAVKQMYDDAVAIVDMLQTLHSDVQAVIELAQDPLGALEGELRDRIDEELEPLETSLEELEETGEQIEQGFELAEDLAALADVSDLAGAPAGGYDAGADPFRE